MEKEEKKYEGYEKHPLYIALYKLHSENIQKLTYETEHLDNQDIGIPPPGIPPAKMIVSRKFRENNTDFHLGNLEEKQVDDSATNKKLMKADQVFAEFLNNVAKNVNKNYYKQMIKFIFLYRECYNTYGKKIDNLNINKEDNEYCLANNAELVPDISNDFVTIYLESHKTGLKRIDSIEMTQNFCCWLYTKGYTNSKLTLIKENNTQF